MKRAPLLLLLTFTLTACQTHNADRLQSRIPRIMGTSPQPLKKIDVAKAYPAATDLKELDDFFKVVGAVMLEQTEHSMLGEIKSYTLVEDQWFVIDWQKGFYRFDFEGRFMSQVARMGQGPGEYQDPSHVLTWGDKVVLDDVGTGSLKIYDRDGRFISELHGRDYGVYVSGAYAFDGNRWYVGNFGARSDAVPDHAIFDIQEGKPNLVGGFGQRFAWAYQPHILKKVPVIGLDAFRYIKDRVWVASPYRSTIDVYDRDGYSLGKLNPGVPGLAEEDFDDIATREERIELMTEKYRNGGLANLSPYVFASYHRMGRSTPRFSVFDEEGNLILKNIERGSGIQGLDFLHTCGPYLVTPIESNAKEEHLRKYFDQEEWDNLLASGYDPATFEGGNPMLILSVLREELRPTPSELTINNHHESL